MSTPAAANLNLVIERFGIADSAINDGERPWIRHTRVPDTYWQPVRFDVRNGAWTFIVHIQKPGALGRHQHHGQVFAYVIEGSWFYEEYDWVAEAGAVVHEAPGAIHTLRSDHPQGMKTLFTVNGAMDFFDDDDNRIDQETVFHFVDQYVKYCEENGLEIDQRLFA
jgi:2,4'-dihydroxyacetophenone dioxygenase